MVDSTNKLKPISIRLPPKLISDLKVLAKEKGFPGYQKLIKDTLHSYVRSIIMKDLQTNDKVYCPA